MLTNTLIACPTSSPLMNTWLQYKTEGEDESKDAILFLLLKPYSGFTQLVVTQMMVFEHYSYAFNN